MKAIWLWPSVFRLIASAPACVGAGAWSSRGEPGSLLLQRSTRNLDPEAAGSALEDTSTVAFASVRTNRRVLPVGWFGGFSEGESTFNSDAQDVQDEFPDRDALWESGLRSDIRTPDGLTPAWFHESPSGGPDQVWQTHYPYLDDVADRSHTPPWRRTVRGRWQQKYKPPGTAVANSKAASWFDSGVEQYDSYGRVREPRDRSGRRYVNSRQVVLNASLACSRPGCVASTLVRVHGPGGNGQCSLSLWVHPTDYDDEHSKEELEWVRINGEVVNTHCDPMVKSCGNGTSVVPATNRYQCIDHFHVSHLLRNGDGLISVEAKNSDMVDECPIDGALLKADLQLNCFVEEPEPTQAPPTPKPLGCRDTVPLRCRSPGCTASNAVRLDPAKFPGGTCKLRVSFYQTDFDSDHGSEEQVDAIWVNSELVMLSCKPGGNPCKQQNVTQWITCIGNLDVTRHAFPDGIVIVTAKISNKVDECGRNGNLLEAEVSVECSNCTDDAAMGNGPNGRVPGLPPPLGGWPPGVLGPGGWPPGARPPGGTPPSGWPSDSIPGAPEFGDQTVPALPWTCKCRKRRQQGVVTRECRKNGYLVADCNDPIPTSPPGAPQPTWPPGWNVNAKPDRLNGNGFEANQNTSNNAYTCACRNGTRVENGVTIRVRQCIKNGCLVKNCKERINVANCTIVESWNQCDCRIVPKNGTFGRECRLQGKIVQVCPQDQNATAEFGRGNGSISSASSSSSSSSWSNFSESVTETPTMFLESALDSLTNLPKPLEHQGENPREYAGTEGPSVQFGDWEDEEVPEFWRDLIA